MTELLDHNELALALNMMAGALADDSAPVSDQERGEMLGLAAEMETGDLISQSLALCPPSA